MKSLFFMYLMMFTMSSLLMKSMFILWALLEINIIFFMSMMNNSKQSNNNSLMKYFIIQSLSSNIMILLIIMKPSSLYMENWYNTPLMMSMMIKLGLFPFNNWYFQVTENLSWDMYFFINTIQKIIPMLIMFNILPSIYVTCTTMTMNSLFSSMEMLTNNSMRWLMNCSSLNHLSWMIMAMHLTNLTWEMYLWIYMFTLWLMYSMMKKYNMNSLNNWMTINKSNNNMISSMIIIMNFMGIPPLLNFFLKFFILMKLKWLTMMTMILMNNIIMSYTYMYINYKILFNQKKLLMMSTQTTKPIFIVLMFIFTLIILMLKLI